MIIVDFPPDQEGDSGQASGEVTADLSAAGQFLNTKLDLHRERRLLLDEMFQLIDIPLQASLVRIGIPGWM